MEITKIGVMSAAKITGAIYAALGFLIGAIFTILSLIGAVIAATSSAQASIIGMIFGIGAIILLPIVYGIMGFVFGAIGAWIYNIIASKTGGIILETK
ncbi:MAG: hypothetical protein COV47_02455 [Candidatus Diapherotrites archaeon CG11_big_fil_rev_8_21_14_0_20_37_9]|nr:MAG: hypothetical protein COV47_02455 [Candidatus Diapherotrites archaeon CG11_big_fil_rev_8_21_14_0_20_37_9]